MDGPGKCASRRAPRSCSSGGPTQTAPLPRPNSNAAQGLPADCSSAGPPISVTARCSPGFGAPNLAAAFARPNSAPRGQAGNTQCGGQNARGGRRGLEEFSYSRPVTDDARWQRKKRHPSRPKAISAQEKAPEDFSSGAPPGGAGQENSRGCPESAAVNRLPACQVARASSLG